MFKSAYETLGGIVWIPRMLEKIRMNQRGEIPEDYLPYLGKGFDKRCVQFLGVDYDDLVKQTIAGASDEQIINWIFQNGRKPTKDEILIWNDFMAKRGWRDQDENPEAFQSYKEKYGVGHRDDILTYFDFYEVDEGRRT